MKRDHTKDPRPGDVLVVDLRSSVYNAEVQHHLAVTERYPRSVELLAGVLHNGEGQTGGSPHKIKLATWRALAAKGRISVRSEECLSGWGAIQASWEREKAS